MRLPVLNNQVERQTDHLVDELSRLTRGQVRFSAHDRMLYATDASLYQVEPIGVVVPASVDEVPGIVAWCAKEGVPVLPRGGGTSLAGQCTNRAVVVDLSPTCRAIGGVHAEGTFQLDAPANDRVWVEPGVTIDEINREVLRQTRGRGNAPAGLFFAPDPATTSQACLGGCIGNNSAGARSIRYGRTSENLAALDVALSTGERVTLQPLAGFNDATAFRLARGAIDIALRHAALIRERFPRTVRRNAGYGLDLVLDQIDAFKRERGVTGALTASDIDELARRVDLSGLLCGSEGTLAVTLRARLKLHPLPAAKGLAVLSFATLEHAIDAVRPLLDMGLPLGLSAVELLDDVVLEAAMGNIEYRRYVELLPGGHTAAYGGLKAVLYVEFFGFGSAEDAAADVKRGFETLRAFAPSLAGMVAMEAHTAAAAMLSAWKLRKAGEPLLHGLPGRRKPITFVEDNAVPVERLAEFVREFKKIVGGHGTRAAYWAHASVGVLHVRPMIDLHDESDRARMRDIAVQVADLARACGGIMSGEHGDGRVRGPLLERFFGPELMSAFAELKRLFDPAGILNPGNIVGAGPVESMTQNLRTLAASNVELPGDEEEPHAAGHGHDDPHGHSHASADTHGHSHDAGGGHGTSRAVAGVTRTYYDYTDQHGFRGAVEACNGAGLCRKRSGGGGTMCPSYMALLDERHATRGRGNALRLAITGQFPGAGGGEGGAMEPNWNDAETVKTLDLCLSCKACKAECPSNVDIARLKAEYTAQRYRGAGRVPLSAKLIGNVRALNRLGSMMPGLANWGASLRPVRAILNRVMKMHPRRSLPRFERSLYAWWRDHERTTAFYDPGQIAHVSDTRRGVVVLFADCFTAYNEPHIGIAAVRVLERLGYAVELLPKQGAVTGSLAGPPPNGDACGGANGGVSGGACGGATGFGGGCCGRSMISVGMLEDAIKTIDGTLGSLAGAARDPNVKAIVVCEPSCLSAIKDDWLQLKLATPLAIRREVAAKSMLVEEFVAKHLAEHPEDVPARAEAGPGGAAGGGVPAEILLHAHCHQKALWGSASSGGMLDRLAPGRVKILDTGCCGMAGSFGYSEHRFDLSNQIGELVLFPAARDAVKRSTREGEIVLTATGTSCRHQLHDGVHVKAPHPIEIADAILNGQ